MSQLSMPETEETRRAHLGRLCGEVEVAMRMDEDAGGRRELRLAVALVPSGTVLVEAMHHNYSGLATIGFLCPLRGAIEEN